MPAPLRSVLRPLAPLLLAACGDSGITTPAAPGSPVEPPGFAADPGKALSAYLHDLSPRLDGVTAENAVPSLTGIG